MKRTRDWTWTMNERITVYIPSFGIARGWARSRGPGVTHVSFARSPVVPAVIEIRADQEGVN